MPLIIKLKIILVAAVIIAFSTTVVLWLDHVENNHDNNIRLKAYKQGWKDGCDKAMDTVNVILSNQVHSDTTTTHLTIGGSRDTISYILDHKHVKP